jgi:hypothetical protein
MKLKLSCVPPWGQWRDTPPVWKYAGPAVHRVP